jgi:hypothetical protein
MLPLSGQPLAMLVDGKMTPLTGISKEEFFHAMALMGSMVSDSVFSDENAKRAFDAAEFHLTLLDEKSAIEDREKEEEQRVQLIRS